MWQKLFNAPWPDASDIPKAVRIRASLRIHEYWRGRMWTLVLGELVLWVVALNKDPHHLRAYAVPVLLTGIAYVLGWFPSLRLPWLIGLVVLFAMQGMLIRGLGGVTALSFMLPYTFSAMMLGKRKRLLVQAICVVGFWFSLIYDYIPLWDQLDSVRYFLVSYNILIAAVTFQGLRFLNQLSLELTTEHTTHEVTQRSQQFLARVSHELRTPLNSILGFAKLIKPIDLPAEKASYLAQIVEEGAQLDHLISDLLDSAQLSAGKLILKPDICDVNAICSAVGSEIEALLKPDVALNLALAPDVPSIQADPQRLRQVVRNLVSNAAKYTEQGAITVSTNHRESEICITVGDTGPGIPEDQQPLIFVPFVKLDNRSQGIGLGLDIAMQLTKLHGGTITLDSMVGEGSTFTVTLPIASTN